MKIFLFATNSISYDAFFHFSVQHELKEVDYKKIKKFDVFFWGGTIWCKVQVYLYINVV